MLAKSPDITETNFDRSFKGIVQIEIRNGGLAFEVVK